MNFERELQNYLLSIDRQSINSLVQHTSRMNWLSSDDNMKDLLSIILDISNFRPRESDLYTELCHQLCKSKSKFKLVLSSQMRADLFINPAFKATFPSHIFFYQSLYKNHKSLINFDPIDELNSGITPSFGIGVFQLFKKVPSYLDDMIISYLHRLIEFYSGKIDSKIYDNITSTHPMFMPESTPFNERLFNSILNDDLEAFIEETGDFNPQYDCKIGVISHMWDELRFAYVHRLTNDNYVKPCDLAALFGSIRIFKFLLTNGVNVSRSLNYAIAGGNVEIIRLISQKGASPTHFSAEIAYKCYQNEILDWILETIDKNKIKVVMSNNLHHFKLFKIKTKLNYVMMEEIVVRRYVSLMPRIDVRSIKKLEALRKKEEWHCFITNVAQFICLVSDYYLHRMSTKPLNSSWINLSRIDFNDYQWNCEGKIVEINKETFKRRRSVFYGTSKHYGGSHFIERRL